MRRRSRSPAPRPICARLRPVGSVVCALALGAAACTLRAAPVDVHVLGSDGKPLPDAVVFFESTAAKAAAKPLSGVEIPQDKRQFSRRVTVVTTGTEVQFPNLDTVRHHVYSFSPTKKFELKLYTGKPSNPVTFDRSGIAVLGCNIHDNMVAWVVVVDTPHFGITNASGSVRIDLPAGAYRLRSWHPALAAGAPAQDEAYTVTAGGGSTKLKLPVTAAAL